MSSVDLKRSYKIQSSFDSNISRRRGQSSIRAFDYADDVNDMSPAIMKFEQLTNDRQSSSFLVEQ